jgi:hypothetical protein
MFKSSIMQTKAMWLELFSVMYSLTETFSRIHAEVLCLSLAANGSLVLVLVFIMIG